MRAGASKVRCVTSSRSELRSTVVRFFIAAGSRWVSASIDLLLPVQFLDNVVQLVEARFPEPAIPLDPVSLFLQPVPAQPAGSNPPDLLGRDEIGLLQDEDMLPHAREG